MEKAKCRIELIKKENRKKQKTNLLIELTCAFGTNFFKNEWEKLKKTKICCEIAKKIFNKTKEKPNFKVGKSIALFFSKTLLLFFLKRIVIFFKLFLFVLLFN